MTPTLRHDPPTPTYYHPSLRDALPISAFDDHLVAADGEGHVAAVDARGLGDVGEALDAEVAGDAEFIGAEGEPLAAGLDDAVLRSEEHTSELQSRENLVCRLLLEKKKR